MLTENDSKDIRTSNFILSNFNSTSVSAENGKTSEYNALEHRKIEHPNSTMGALAHLMKCSLGAGVLAIPMAFKNSGLLFGAIGTLIVGFVCTHCVRILVRTSHEVCKRTKEPSLGFSETAEKVFETGPIALRKYSKFARAFCEYGMSATYMGVSCVLIVHMATSISKVISYTCDVNWDIRIYIAIVLVPCIILGEVRHLKYLVPFSTIANLCLVATFGVILYYMFTGPMEIEKRPLFASWHQLPVFFCTVIYAIEGIGAVLPIENTMQKPEKFYWILNTAMSMVIIFYVTLGFLGYIRYGDAIEASITLNLPRDELIAQMAQILISFVILTSFSLHFFVAMDILWRKLAPRISTDKHNVTEIFFRGGAVITLGGIAAAVPKLDPFIGLVGAIFFSSLGLMIPAIIETVFRYPDQFGFANWILFKNIFLVVFSVLAAITGSSISIKEIIDMYS